MAHYDIKITFDGTNAIPPDPIPPMSIGDTVQYFSNEGEVLVVFPQSSPFRPDSTPATFVVGGEPVTAKQLSATKGSLEGFPCRCFVRPPGKPVFSGWLADPSPSGGNHVVR